jgi:hypothetical protein
MKWRFLQKSIPVVLLFSITSACALLNSLGGKPTVLTSADGNFQLTVPPGWQQESGLNPEAVIQAANRSGKMYAMVISESKQDFTGETKLAEFTSLTRNIMLGRLSSPEATEPKPTTISGNSALQYELRGVVQGLNLMYIVTTVETPQHYHQVITWTQPSQIDNNRSTMLEVTQSFKEVGAAKP